MGASVTSVLIVSCAKGLVTALRQNDGPSEPINHPLVGTRSLRQAGGGRANGLGVNIVPNPSCRRRAIFRRVHRRALLIARRARCRSASVLVSSRVQTEYTRSVLLQRDTSMEWQGGAVS